MKLSVDITPIANAASLYVAIDQGFFEDEGLTVTPEVIQNASTAVPSLLNDELQVALMTSVPAVTAASKGVPIEIVSGNDRYPEDPSGDTTALVAASGSGVETAGDLGGKTVAVVGLKSAPELALRIVLRDSGVDPDDVEVVEIAYPDMSGGMQQRAAIARSLAYRPEVLIMDEPFASVDAQTRAELEDLMLAIRERLGVTIVLVTHDIDEAVCLGDRVVVLSGKPASVSASVEIPLGRDRNQIVTKSEPGYLELRAQIHRMITDASRASG